MESMATDTELPLTMRALVIDQTGAPEVLHMADRPLPRQISDEVLVKVVAAGLNPIDAKTRSGKGVAAAIEHYPAILGNDFSGVVVRAAFEAAPLQPGDEVYGMGRMPRTAGSFAEYVSVSSMSVTRKPSTLSHIEAAAVPVAALTAWGMVTLAGAAPGQRMLVHAGSGGVGHFAVQFARLLGAHVTATASTRNREFLRELGIDTVIDYSTTRFEDVARDQDSVIDLIGNVHDNTGTRSLRALRPGGLLVNAPTGSWPTLAADAEAAGRRATGFKVSPDAGALDEISAMIDAGTVRVHVDSVFELADGAKAHSMIERGHTRGKIVLRIS